MWLPNQNLGGRFGCLRDARKWEEKLGRAKIFEADMNQTLAKNFWGIPNFGLVQFDREPNRPRSLTVWPALVVEYSSQAQLCTYVGKVSISL